MTVRELLSRIDSAELTEWAAYEDITGPLGPERADIHMAILAATITNANSGKGRKAKPKDFLPRWDKHEQTWQEQLAAVRAINRALGGTENGRAVAEE